MADERRTVQRAVRSDDPGLTPEANAMLSGELRDAVGRDSVEVPVDAPDRRGERNARHGPLVSMLITNRITVGITIFVLLGVAAIVALTTGHWWILPLAFVFLGLLVTLFAVGILQMTTEVEHVSPVVAARLEDEGVGDPDAHFTELVEEFATERDHRGASKLASSDYDERMVTPSEDPAAATAEQRSAFTPTSDATRPVGPGSDAADDSRR